MEEAVKGLLEVTEYRALPSKDPKEDIQQAGRPHTFCGYKRQPWGVTANHTAGINPGDRPRSSQEGRRLPLTLFKSISSVLRQN